MLLELLASLLLAGMMPWLFFFSTCVCCATAVCNHCSGSTAKNTIQVDIAGMANGAGCASCASLDGTYILTETNLPHGSGSGACIWGFLLSPAVCVSPNDYTFIQANVTGPSDPGGNPNELQVVLVGNGLTTTHVCWTTGAAGYDDCTGWSSFNVPYSASCASGVACDNSAATCAVTAL